MASGRAGLAELRERVKEMRAVYEYVPCDGTVRELVRELLGRQRRIVNTFPRFCTRLYAVLTPARRQYPTSQLIGLLSVGTAMDLLVWAALARSGRDDWRWRAPFCGVDAAAWARYGPNGHFDSIPSLMLWPMFAELTHNQNGQPRRRVFGAAAAMVLPAIVDGKIIRRTRVPLFSWRWPALSVVVVAVFRLFLRQRIMANEGQLVEGLERTTSAAKAAGSQRAIPRLTRGSESTRDWLNRQRVGRLRELGAHDLVEMYKYLESKRNERSNDVVELGPILAEWEIATFEGSTLDEEGQWQHVASSLDFNKTGPIIRCDLVQQDLGYQILTANQAAQLRHQLSSRAELIPNWDRGSQDQVVVEVSLRRRNTALPLGESLDLIVNGQLVTIASDLEHRPVADEPFDPTAFAFMLDAVWAINDLRWRPERAAGPLVAACLSTLVAIELGLRRRVGRHVGSGGVMARALVLQAVGTAVTVGKGEAWKSDGSRLVWPLARAELPLFLLAAHWGELSEKQRRVSMTAMSVISFLGGLTTARGRWGPLDVLLQALFVVQGTVPAFKITTWSFYGLERELAEVRRQELLEIARKAELEESSRLLQASQDLYLGASTLLGERSSDVSRFLDREGDQIEELREQIRLSAQGSFDDGYEAIRAISSEATVVVVDVDNTLVPYGATPEERNAAVREALHLAEMSATIRSIVFVSNSRAGLEEPQSDTVDVTCISRARKPLVWLSPLRQHRSRLSRSVVIGDQPLTDGGLALLLDCRYLSVRGFGGEALWPRLLRRTGEFVL